MRPLYDILTESILDDDEKIINHNKRYSSEAGRVMRIIIDCFYKKFSWDDGVRYVEPKLRLKGGEDNLFSIQYNVYDKYLEAFRYELKKNGFKIAPTYGEDNHKQFSLTLKGFGGSKVTIVFKAFSDRTYIEVRADKKEQDALVDLFDEYTSVKQ